MVSSRREASKSTPCTYHGALIPKAASNSWVWFIGSRCLAGLVAAFCRNQPSLSLLLQRASSIRFAGLAPVLDPPTHPLRIEKRRIISLPSSYEISKVLFMLHYDSSRQTLVTCFSAQPGLQ